VNPIELNDFERGQIVAALGYGGLSRLDNKLKDKLLRPAPKPVEPAPSLRAEG
jgi:hypothetical protein